MYASKSSGTRGCEEEKLTYLLFQLQRLFLYVYLS